MGSPNMNSRVAISCLILPLCGTTMARQYLRAETQEMITQDSWADLADTLLCAGNSAEEIRDGLRAVWPNNHWFVLVQDSELLWFSNKDLSTELHHADDLCGKNLVVWMYSDEESYSLTHWFTISWMTGSDLSSSTAQSCKVENSQAWYLIKTGPSLTEQS